MPELTRRCFGLALMGSLALPAPLRAQTADPSPALTEDAPLGDRVDALRRAALDLPQLHAILVQRDDEIVLAEAPRGRGLDRAANIKSCSKSILALLLGTAIARGEVPGLTATLATVAPQLVPSDATAGAADLTLSDLVTLRAGLQGTSGENYGAWVNSRNWVAYALRQPRIAPNGGQMIYSTGTTHILGAALVEATGRTLRDLARDRLGAPLGIDIPDWTRDPQGYHFGGNEMALTPNAMLRVALVMRDAGQHGGQQILPAEWIAASRVVQTRSPFSGLGYGLGWFLSTSGWVLARGYGGQIIAAHPDRRLAVAITSDPTLPARSEGYFGDLMRLLDGPVLALG